MGGVLDAVGGLFGADSGPSGAVGYTSPYTRGYEDSSRQGIYERLGARRKLKRGAKPDQYGNYSEDQYEYDVSGTTKPIDPAEAAKKYQGMGYMQNALNKMQNKSQYNEVYNSTYDPRKNAYTATTYNFQATPERVYNEAIRAGSKDILRANQGNLAKLQEAVGVRRPGLLLKAGQQANRDIGEQLASLSTSLREQAAKEKADLATKQQMEQAAENLIAKQFGEGQEQFKAGEGYKGYLSRAEREKLAADEAFRRDTGYGDMARAYLTGEMGATEAERAYRDKALEYLMNMWRDAAGITSSSEQAGQSARDKAKQRSTDMFGSIMGAAGSIFGK